MRWIPTICVVFFGISFVPAFILDYVAISFRENILISLRYSLFLRRLLSFFFFGKFNYVRFCAVVYRLYGVYMLSIWIIISPKSIRVRANSEHHVVHRFVAESWVFTYTIIPLLCRLDVQKSIVEHLKNILQPL